MFGTTLIVRKPRQSEMALSNQVKASIEEAAQCLRDALAFAARSEHPVTIHTISEMLTRIESLESLDSIMQTIGKTCGPKGEDTH